MIPNEIDAFRTRVWLDEVKRQTGCQTIRELASRLDPGSVWTDREGFEHQSKWYQYSNGVQVPAPSLFRRIQGLVPKARFELHHPVWRVLRGNCSDRTWSRLRSALLKKWGSLPDQLMTLPVEALRSSAAIGNALAQQRLSYLDALALFACTRRSPRVRSDIERVKGFAQLLWALPVLYAEDQMWNASDLSMLTRALRTMDQALGIDATDSDCSSFEIRSIEIVARRDRVALHLGRYPNAFSKGVSLRRFLAARWDHRDRTQIRPYRGRSVRKPINPRS